MEQTSPRPTSYSLALHESAHAVAGICLGLRGRLEWISTIENEKWKGGCKWNLEGYTGIPGEDYAINFAGPLAQVIHLPEAFGEDIVEFRRTIDQPRERLLKHGAGGWLATDLRAFKYLLPHHPFLHGADRERMTLRGIERRMRDLLSRPTVESAIKAVANQLVGDREVHGAIAEQVIVANLAPSDFVPWLFLCEAASSPKGVQ